MGLQTEPLQAYRCGPHPPALSFFYILQWRVYYPRALATIFLRRVPPKLRPQQQIFNE